MDAEKADYSISRMAELLGVSRSGFYDWPAAKSRRRRRRSGAGRCSPSGSSPSTRRLITCTSPRILADLRAAGQTVSAKTVAKLMRASGIAGISPRAFAPVTTLPRLIRGRCRTWWGGSSTVAS